MHRPGDNDPHTHDAAGRLAISTPSSLDFDDAVSAVKEALSREGFGVLTEIDMSATLTEKLGGDHEHYLILGACHAPSAQRLLEAEPAFGVLLPCNVVVSSEEDTTMIRAMDPAAVIASVLAGAQPSAVDTVAVIETIADDIAGRLRSALSTVD